MGRSVSSKGEGAELIPNRGGFWRKILDWGAWRNTLNMTGKGSWSGAPTIILNLEFF
jgi:hypothetical protein